MGRLRNVRQGLSQQGSALPAAPVGNGAPPAGGGGMTQPAAATAATGRRRSDRAARSATDASSIRRPTARFDGRVDDAGRRASAVGAGESCRARLQLGERRQGGGSGDRAQLARRCRLLSWTIPGSGVVAKAIAQIKQANLAMAGQVLPMDAVLPTKTERFIYGPTEK